MVRKTLHCSPCCNYSFRVASGKVPIIVFVQICRASQTSCKGRLQASISFDESPVQYFIMYLVFPKRKYVCITVKPPLEDLQEKKAELHGRILESGVIAVPLAEIST